MNMINRVTLGAVCALWATVGMAGDGLRDKDHELNRNFPKKLAGSDITLRTTTGVSFKAYSVGAKNAKRGILLVHEWWGLNDHIRSWADRFAALGYRALAVDLYGSQVATDPGTARTLMQTVDQTEANAKHRAALEELKAPGRKLATMGWCFGGGQSLQASLAAPELVAATVIYYGPLITDSERLSFLSAPVLGIFAEHDTSITVETVRAFEAAMKQADKSLELHFYDAHHGFANPSAASYNTAAADAAWEVARSFLDRNL